MTDRGGVVGAALTPSKPPSEVELPTALQVAKGPIAAVLPRVDNNERAWNMRQLPVRIGADAVAAASAGFLVAPIITIIDRGIIENVTGKRTLAASIRASLQTIVLRPHHFFFSKPFALIFTLYTGTYLTANSVDTASSTLRNKSASTTTHGTSKFAATSLANLSLCLWKDSHFTRLFSPVAPRPVPAPTYLLFALRDSMTICASFNIPPVLAPHIPTHAFPELMRGIRKETYAQFIAPAAVQVFSTPMHLLGLNFYSENGTTTLRQRWDAVRGAWAVSTLARLCRIVPAFGVGGVVNAGVRRNLMASIEG